MRALLLLLTPLLCTLANGAAPAECSDYAGQLASMRAADQAIRMRLTNSPEVSRTLENALDAVDGTNLARMTLLLEVCGWPVASKYGIEASNDAWMLVQHADRDRKFQHRALVLLERAVELGQARRGDLAYLSDRLAVSEGRVQLYGTQFKGIQNCRLVLAPIDSRDAVDERRRAIPGMPSLEEYERYANAHISPPECQHQP